MRDDLKKMKELSESPKKGDSFIEKIGFYNPIAKDSEEKIKLDQERYEYWKSVGAVPSDTVSMLFERSQMSDEEIAKIEKKKAEAKTNARSSAS